MKILLAAMNAKYIHSNLAVHSLKRYAWKFSEHIKIAEFTINQYTEDILRNLYKEKPDVLAFSCYIWNINYVKELIADLHKILPETELWLGGPEVFYDAEVFLKEFPQVKGIMIGEGEKTFFNLAKGYIEEKDDRNFLKRISGIVYRDLEKNIIANPQEPPMNMSEIPFAYETTKEFANKIIYYESSRGCPFFCSYCLSSTDKDLRFRDLELVKKELKYFIDEKVPQVKFVDRTFNCNHHHAVEIWKFISENDNHITNFHFEIAADLLNKEEIQLLKTLRPGLVQLEIGVQSTNQKTIEEIDRTMKFSVLEKVVSSIKEGHNIHQHLDLIAGLPYEDYESFRNSFNQVYALKPDQLQLGFLKVLKGSKMRRKAKEYHLLYKSSSPYEVLSTDWLTYEEVLKIKGVEEMLEIYYNSGQFSNTVKVLEGIFGTPFDFYQSLAVYYEDNGLNLVSHSRISRYDILLDFIKLWDAGNLDLYKELLLYDLYLRENLKKRPEWAEDSYETKEDKEYIRNFYMREAEDFIYLKEYRGYDYRQLNKMTHIEKFTFHVTGSTVEEIKSKETCFVLFDYKVRDILSKEAQTFLIRQMQ